MIHQFQYLSHDLKILILLSHKSGISVAIMFYVWLPKFSSHRCEQGLWISLDLEIEPVNQQIGVGIIWDDSVFLLGLFEGEGRVGGAGGEKKKTLYLFI